MLMVILKTKGLDYTDSKLGAHCKSFEWAYCKFMPYYPKPQCNVPLECFDREHWRITPKQQDFYSFALSIVRAYNAAEKECLYYNLPWSVLEMVVELMADVDDADSSYCSPIYYVRVMLDASALEEIDRAQYNQYALVSPFDVEIAGQSLMWIESDQL